MYQSIPKTSTKIYETRVDGILTCSTIAECRRLPATADIAVLSAAAAPVPFSP